MLSPSTTSFTPALPMSSVCLVTGGRWWKPMCSIVTQLPHGKTISRSKTLDDPHLAAHSPASRTARFAGEVSRDSCSIAFARSRRGRCRQRLGRLRAPPANRPAVLRRRSPHRRPVDVVAPDAAVQSHPHALVKTSSRIVVRPCLRAMAREPEADQQRCCSPRRSSRRD